MVSSNRDKVMATSIEVHLRPAAGSVQDLLGKLHRPDIPPRTIEEMREGMIDYLVQEDERIKKGSS